MTQESEISGTKVLRVAIAGQATAGTADEFIVAVAGRNMKLISAKFIAKAAVTANGTNFYTLTVRNRKADASGAAQPFTRSLAATNIAAFIADPLTASATAADLLVAAGDVLTCEKLVTASGLALPAGTLEVSYQER